LDISWNGLRPNHLIPLLDALGENRQLQYLNLSWNTLVENADISAERGGLSKVIKTEIEVQEFISNTLKKLNTFPQESN
jgi:hypothetical protein